MANLSAIKLPNGTTYTIKDNNALPLTGGSITGPVSFGDSVTMDEATVGDLVVNGSGSFTNNLQANTINGVTVGNSPKFTDTNTEVSTFTLAAGTTAGTALSHGGKYTLTAGSKTVSFTMPSVGTIPSITLNGSTTTSPSFYAPTGAGTSGQYLKSSGSGAPTWTNFPTIPSITLNGSSTTSPSFYAPTTAGTSGQILQSSGSGAPTWTNAATNTTWWGTSSTTASTTEKVVTCANFTLTTGAVISVYFSTGNTADVPTLNVNSTGAKAIYVGDSVCNGTTNVLKWSANTTLTFMYDGTYWKYISSVSAGSVAPSRGAGTWHGYSYTSASLDTKISVISNFVLTKGAVVAINFALGNSSDSLNLNVSYTGSKSVYRGTSAVSESNPLKWSDGETLTFMYDGTYWNYISSSCNIGAKNWVAPSAVSCQSGKWYKVAEVTLDPGIWFIDCNALFPKTNATGTRQIRVTTDTFTNGTTTMPDSYGNITNDIIMGANIVQYPQSHFPVDISSRTTFRLAAYQGSGSTMSVTGRMYATRIK